MSSSAANSARVMGTQPNFSTSSPPAMLAAAAAWESGVARRRHGGCGEHGIAAGDVDIAGAGRHVCSKASPGPTRCRELLGVERDADGGRAAGRQDARGAPRTAATLGSRDRGPARSRCVLGVIFVDAPA
ncbi:MAG: hypothetical protein U1A27_01300 [Phycisphaerae bacterium]